MKINQSNSNINQNPILINTLVKQVSDLQIDTSEIKSDLTDLETAVNTHITFNRDGDGRTEVNNLASNDALISNANIQHANISNLSSANGTIGDLTSTNGTITNLDTENADINTADIGTLNVASASNLKRTTVDGALTVSGLTTTEDVHAQNIESISVHTADVETTALSAVSGDISTVNSDNITASNKITTKDLEVTGDITGVSDIEMHDLLANEIKANSADIDKITWIEQILDNTHVIDPSPELGNNDRYTIQLPKFAGWYIITCLGESNTIKWAATVRGNGFDYSISWFSSDIEESIKNFYQYDGRLYIRHAANGTIAFAYSADRDLPDPTIYFNMDGWTQYKDLPELCDEDYQYDVINPSGTIFFGLFVAPRFQGSEGNGAINFKGSCTVSDLAAKLRDPEISVGDVWNILDYGYTTSDFVEGAGRPINIDDDVVAVENEVEDLEVSDLGENDGYKWPYFNGAHWSLVENWIGTPGGVVKTELDGTETTYALDADIRPVRDSKLIKGTNCLLFVTNEAIVRSEDGENWTKVADLRGMGHDLQSDIIKLHNGTLLCIYHYEYYDESVGTNVEGCQKAISTDDGLTWDITDYPAIENFMPSYLLSDTNSVYAYRGTAKLWISNDNGNTFSEITTADSQNYHEYGNTIISIDKGISKIYMLNKSTMTWDTYNWTDDPYKIIDTINMNSPAILKVDDNADRTVDLLITHDFGNSWEKLGSLNLSNSPSMYHVINNKIIYDNRSIITHFSGKALRWDKFAAGVNYEDFRAKKITAEEELISGGTLEVDGDSTFKGNIELDNTTSEISATGNLELSVTGATTETYTGAKTVTLAAGETITGDVTQHGNKTLDGDLTQTGDQDITGDVTLNGDLTQTGDQNITGEVVISEKESINSLSPADAGYYITHDSFELGNQIISSKGVPTTAPVGEAQTPELLLEGVYRYNHTTSGSNIPELVIRNGQQSNVLIFLIGNTYYSGYSSQPVYEPTNDPHLNHNFDEIVEEPITGSLYGSSVSGFIYYDNKIYAKAGNNYYQNTASSNIILDNSWFSLVSNTSIISALGNIEPQAAARVQRYSYLYKGIRTISSGSIGYSTDAYSSIHINQSQLSGPENLYYVPYREFIHGVDPGATYNPIDEVLSVNGNENITRDLKVQGNIFGEQYHTAFLPNVTSTEINTENLTANVVTIGDLD